MEALHIIIVCLFVFCLHHAGFYGAMLGKGNENSGQNYCGKPVFSNEEIVSRVFWCVVFHLQEEHRGWRTLEVFLDPVPLLMCLGANKQQADPLKQKDTLIIV